MVSQPGRSSFLNHSFEKGDSTCYVALGLFFSDMLHLPSKAGASEVNTEMGPEPQRLVSSNLKEEAVARTPHAGGTPSLCSLGA